MCPANDIDGILSHEKELDYSHVIILLFVKPSDDNSDSFIKRFNYFHQRSKRYCTIYPIGYCNSNMDDFRQCYPDAEEAGKVENKMWLYSDACFDVVRRQLEKRLKNWRYCGEPEMIFLQNSSSFENGIPLDFRNYNYIDINYGLQNGYIKNFARFMEHIFSACQREVEARRVIDVAQRNRLNSREIVEIALEYDKCLPAPVKKIIKNKLFFKSCKN